MPGDSDAPDGLSPSAKGSVESVAELGFKCGQAGVEQLAFRDDDHVEPWRDLIATENLSNETFSSVSIDRAAQFTGRGNSQSSHRKVVGKGEQRQISTMDLRAAVVNGLVFRSPANTFALAETRHFERLRRYFVLTVSRLRPFARRRFRTRRPFLVLILTRKPCVRFRCLVFG